SACLWYVFFFFQAEDGIRDHLRALPGPVARFCSNDGPLQALPGVNARGRSLARERSCKGIGRIAAPARPTLALILHPDGPRNRSCTRRLHRRISKRGCLGTDHSKRTGSDRLYAAPRFRGCLAPRLRAEGSLGPQPDRKSVV